MFIYHGKKDNLYPLFNAELSYEYIRESLYKINYKDNLKYIVENDMENTIFSAK